MSRPSHPRRFLSALAIAGGAIVLVEVGLRAIHFKHPPAERPIVLWSPERDPGLASKDGLFQRDLGALWVPRPQAEIPVPHSPASASGAASEIAAPSGVSVSAGVERVNSAGYRGPLVPFRRPQGTLRILTLGDSGTFGTGVGYWDTYSGRLQTMLADLDIKAEVIDGGVDGYTIRQGLERYRSLGRAYRPMIVIVAFPGANDAEAAFDLGDEEKIRVDIERNSGLAGFVRRLRGHVRTLDLAAWVGNRHALSEVMAASDLERHHERELARDWGNPNWPGQRRVSPSEFALYLGQLRREANADGARVILVAMPHRASAESEAPVLRQYARAVFTTAVSEDAQVLDAQSRFEVRAKHDGTEDLVLIDAWNPTPLGHDLIAQWLLSLVREQTRNRGSDPADSLR